MAIRKLASIQQILSIEPIPDADNIELAKINGWKTVVKKGEFQVGDLGVFYEVNSIPPDIDLYKFLWTTKDNPQGIRPAKYRLKTMKLRGCLSQGLMLPLNQVLNAHKCSLNAHLGDDLSGMDLTEILGVEKYEKPIQPGGIVVGDYDLPCPKTDEERLQSRPGVLDELRGHAYVITQKNDGMSLSIGLNYDGELSTCIRNNRVDHTVDGIYKYIVEKYNLVEFFKKNPNIILQGELCGPKIQKNFLGLKQVDWFVFNVWDTNIPSYVPFMQAHDKYFAPYNLTYATPLLIANSFNDSLETLLEFAPGLYPGTNNKREGIVVRPLYEEIYSKVLGGRLSFKVIANDYALQEGE